MTKNYLDILMVFPSSGTYYIPSFDYNLGSAYIIAYLNKNGFKAEQYISSESYNVEVCVKKIVERNPKIVGFTVYYTNYMQCALIANGLKSYKSDIIILFGGPTPSVQSKEILKHVESVDICVRYEGEETVLELLSVLSKNDFKLERSNLNEIKGITFRNKNKIIINSDRNVLLSNRFVKNYIDKYPSPYLSEVIPSSKAFPIGIITARGCNQNCVYCNCAVISKKNIFTHSINRVIEELLYLNEKKDFTRHVTINDDGFTILLNRAKRICEQIIENNIKIPLACITRCDKINEEIIDLMKQAGFVSLGFSLESAVPKVLRAIGKVNPPESLKNFDKEIEYIEKLKRMTTYAKKIGFKFVYASLIIGLPGESIQDAKKTLEVAKQLDIDFYVHNRLLIYKGTPLYQNYKKYGYSIRPVGKNNNIITYNNFPFDVNKVKLAPKSAVEKNSIVIDYKNLKILSLNPKRKIQKPYFNNVIINSDILTKKQVKWIQENLAIGGGIIQIHSNKLDYIKNNQKNTLILYDQFSPTMYYQCYYWENSNSKSVLKSSRMIILGEQIGFPIKIKNAFLTLKEYEKGANDMESTICTEHDALDTRTVYNLLLKISKREDPFDFLLNSKPLPHFHNLCRWTNNQANCCKLETAIIGKDDSVRLCWYSDPIGNVDTSFAEILQNILNLRKITEERRKCNECIKKNTCLKCLYPYPLSPEEYCQYKRKVDTHQPARVINSFNVLKDLLFKPLTLLEL
ncbi:MAG: B12-binding domain-containing radical SAM protein [Candidatus Hodarchaeota archaeon]